MMMHEAGRRRRRRRRRRSIHARSSLRTPGGMAKIEGRRRRGRVSNRAEPAPRPPLCAPRRSLLGPLPCAGGRYYIRIIGGGTRSAMRMGASLKVPTWRRTTMNIRSVVTFMITATLMAFGGALARGSLDRAGADFPGYCALALPSSGCCGGWCLLVRSRLCRDMDLPRAASRRAASIPSMSQHCDDAARTRPARGLFHRRVRRAGGLRP